MRRGRRGRHGLERGDYNPMRLLLTIACASLAWAQTCTIYNTAGCPSTGTIGTTAYTYAGPPSLPVFLNGALSSLTGIHAFTAGKAQPAVTLSVQLTGMSASYPSSESMTCPGAGNPTCVYNNAANEEAVLDSLLKPYPTGVGLKSIDMNTWLGPFFTASQYAAACAAYGGGSCTPAYGGRQTWYAASLATYDAVIAYIQATYPGVVVRMAPIATSDVLAVCGITTGAGNFTEAQLQNCVAPLEAAVAARYHVDFMSVVHEICGAMSLYLGTGGCSLSSADAVTFATSLATAVRASSSYAGIKIGVGAILGDDAGDNTPHVCASGNPSGTTPWCAWVASLGLQAAIDYMAVHVYANENGAASETSNYWNGTPTGLLESYGAMLSQIPAGKIRNVDESSQFRWGNGQGDAATYLGCGSTEWLRDGSFAMWAEAVAGTWARSMQLGEFSLWNMEGLIYLTNDPTNNRCANGADTYDATVYQSKGGQVSAEGLIYGRIAKGWSAALQGKAHLTGRARLGH